MTVVADIRRRLTDPAELASALGLYVSAQRQRDGIFVLCPWHAEKHASCSVRLARDGTIAVHCHTCKAGGDALTLIAQARGLDVRADFGAVLREAASIAGVELPARGQRGRDPQPLEVRLAYSIEAWSRKGWHWADCPRDVIEAPLYRFNVALLIVQQWREADRRLDAVLDHYAAPHAAREEEMRRQT